MTPPRLGHLATRKIVAARLAPTFAQVHSVEVEEALDRLERALAGALWEEVLGATWRALLGGAKRLDEPAVLDKVAAALAQRPLRHGKVAALTPGLSAFLLKLDLEAGTASEFARRALETPEGQERAQEGLKEAGQFLADELTRK